MIENLQCAKFPVTYIVCDYDIMHMIIALRSFTLNAVIQLLFIPSDFKRTSLSEPVNKFLGESFKALSIKFVI